MQENFYDLLGIANNSTDYEIYGTFRKIRSKIDSFDEQTKSLYIEAFITLSDINLRIKYDLSLGLNYKNQVPWYRYTYFENGYDFFDINGALFGSKELTELIETTKGEPIRSSVSKDAFVSEGELTADLADYTKKRMENNDYVPYISEKIDCTNLSDEEKFAYFKKIYEKYKKGFSFSSSFAKEILSRDYNSMNIEDATRMSAQQLLISKKGICTHFASLIHEELKTLGLESYFLRMGLPQWFHHIVLYRVNQEWKICDLTNEYLFGNAGYNITDYDYLGIPLEEFLMNNPNAFDVCVVPKLAGDDLLCKRNSLSLREFIDSRPEMKYELQNSLLTKLKNELDNRKLK